MIKVLHLTSFVNSVIIFTSHKASFGLDLTVMQPLSSKNFSDLFTLIKFQSCLVKYLFRLLKSIRNGCSDPD